MTKKKILYSILFFITCILLLISYNGDIFTFSQYFIFDQGFEPGEQEKGEYLLIPAIVLPKGQYTITFSGEAAQRGNGYSIQSSSGLLLQDEFLTGKFSEKVLLDLQQGKTVQVSVTYGTEHAPFTLNTIEIDSKFVIEKSSVTRHASVSLFLILLFGLVYLRFWFPAIWTKIFKQFSTPVAERIFVFLTFLSIIVLSPLLRDSFYSKAPDFLFHLDRIEGIYNGLTTGQFPVRIHPFQLLGYGYANGMFYPDFWLYIPAFFRILGFKPVTAYKIFVFLCNLAAIFSAYFATKKIGKSRYAGLIAAILYTFADYRLTSIYYRAMIGEIQTFVFIPLVVLGLYNLFYTDEHPWGWFAFGCLGIALSHMLSIAIVAPFVIFFLILHIKLIFNNKKIQRGLIFAILFILCLSAYFILPLLEQSFLTQNNFNDLVSISENRSFQLTNNGAIESGVFVNRKYSQAYIGWTFLLLIILFLCSWGKNKKNVEDKIIIGLFSAGILAILMGRGFFPWNLLFWYVSRLQFIWRMFLIATPLLAIGGGLLVNKTTHGKIFRQIIIIIALCISAALSYPILLNVVQENLIEAKSLHLQQVRVGSGEYLPEGAFPDFIKKNKNTVLSSNAKLEVSSDSRKPLKFSFNYKIDHAAEKTAEIEIPLLYYYGYHAEILTSDNQMVSLPTRLGPHGFVTVDIDPAKYPEGRFTTFYQKTTAQKIGDAVTGISLVIILAFAIFKKRKKENC